MCLIIESQLCSSLYQTSAKEYREMSEIRYRRSLSMFARIAAVEHGLQEIKTTRRSETGFCYGIPSVGVAYVKTF